MSGELVSRRARRTLGLLIDWVSTPYHVGILDGVQSFCESSDVNLICFVTGRIGSNLESELCRNVLADLATAETVDGLLVCASSLQNFSGYEHMSAFLSRYDGIPMVTLHESFPGIPSVSVDNSSGVRLLLEHLVDHHGYRRFAFVRGLTGNRDFDERFQAGLDYLASRGLAVDEGLVVQGHYKPQSGEDAVELLEPRRDEIEVLVCANDAIAFGARSAAKKRGWDLPVAGFDDVALARQASLTTVRQSIPDHASAAAALLVRLMNGEAIPLQHHEEPWLVVRGSCGCPANKTIVFTQGCGDGEVDPDGPELADFVNDYDLEDLQDIGEELFSMLDLDEELKVATRDFPKLGIDACCISLYDDPTDPLMTARALAAYDRGRVFPIGREGIQFPTRSILPMGLFEMRERRSLLIQALFRGTEQIGLAVFSIGTRKWRVYEFLRRELSTAIKGASLFRSVREYANDLERQVRARTKELEEANGHLKYQIQERTRIEAELARREEHYRDLVMMLPTLVLETDTALRISFINHAGAELLELPDRATRRESLLKYIAEDDRDYVEESLRGILELKQPASGEFRLVSLSLRSINVLFEADAIVKNGVIRGIRLSGINIGSVFSAAIKPEEVLYKHYHFSPRVKEVLELMLQGYSGKQIALELGISENTVKAHVRAIYFEVGVENRSGLFKVLREYQVHHFGYQSYVFSMLSTLVRN